MVVTCDIQFENNPDGCYYAGQVISGKITLSADKSKQVKAVYLKIHGNAHTEWSETESDDTSTTYSGNIDYINTLAQLLGPQAPAQSVIIEPGIHSFNFVCHIPPNCPSSFEGLHGHIRYTILVSLQRPWKFDHRFTRGFTVLRIMDLNYDMPQLKLPLQSEATKVFCCGPCKTDPLQIHVQLPRSGFVPGELIPVNITVTNETKGKINEINVLLVMRATLYSQTPSRRTQNETTKVSVLKGDPVMALCKKQFAYLLPVPATPPSSVQVCPIIDITYNILVEAKMDGTWYANQVIQIPVTIGNIPLSNVIQQQPLPIVNALDADQIDGIAPAPAARLSSLDPLSGLGDMPAPVYMAATHLPEAKLAEAQQHDYGEEQFSPKYPVYSLANSSSDLEKNGNENNKSTWL